MRKAYKDYVFDKLYKEFTRRFSDSLFTVDEEDERKIKDALISHALIWDTKMKYDRNWIWKRVKRSIASPTFWFL